MVQYIVLSASFKSASPKVPVQGILLKQVQGHNIISNNPTTGDLSPDEGGQECGWMKDGCNSRKIKFYLAMMTKKGFFNISFRILQLDSNMICLVLLWP